MPLLIRILLPFVLACATFVAAGPAAARQAPSGAGANVPAVPASGGDARAAPGDRILLSIWREEELSDTFAIRHDGIVVLPRVGAFQATELPIVALEDSLRRVFGGFVRNPAVEVRVLRRVGVHGEVTTPNLYLVDLTMTLRDVIAAAGGLTEAADPRRIVIVREGEQIEVGNRRGSGVRTAELRSGDQIVVGRRGWVSMNPLAAVSTATGLLTLMVALFFR